MNTHFTLGYKYTQLQMSLSEMGLSTHGYFSHISKYTHNGFGANLLNLYIRYIHQISKEVRQGGIFVIYCKLTSKHKGDKQQLVHF